VHSSLKDTRRAAVIIGGVWIAAFMLVASKFPAADPCEDVEGLWNPRPGQVIRRVGPVPVLTPPAEDYSRADPLRLTIRAQHIRSDGGELICGRARLEVSRNATESGGYFLLEDVSNTALAFRLEHTAGDLTQALTLRISYRGTQYGEQGLDPASLDIYREFMTGMYQRLPSYIDRDAQCVVAETTVPGRYVVG
jgi:hypothetical protein